MPATRATASTSPLRDRPGGDLRRGVGLHVHPAAGDGPAVGGVLGRDVDHAGAAERVEMRELRGRHGGKSTLPAGRDLLPTSRRSGSSTGSGGRSRPGRCGARPTWCRRPGRSRPRAGRRARRRAAPPRRIARRSNSSSANRQVRSLPSAVIRIRSQLLAERLGDAGDHADVADAVGVAERARPARRAADRARAARPLEREHRVDALEDLAARARPGRDVQAPSASRGMNSMKRTPTPRSRPKAARSTTSSSLTPRITTQLTFTGSSPASSGGVDAGEDPVELVAAGEREEDLGAQRVERHVDAPQAGRREVVGHLRQLHAVGGHRDVDAERARACRSAAAGARGRVGSPPVIRTDSKPKRSTQTRTIRACSS